MKIDLMMQPTTPPAEWEEFCNKYPVNSIALDGFVIGGPHWQKKMNGGPRANFNHHEGVNRLHTRATCAQILLAIRHNLFDQFRDENGAVNFKIYANDCDQDVCVSVTLLRHSHMVDNAIAPAINRIVDMSDKLDATAGAYPYPPDLPFLEELAWIFEPYNIFRFVGGISRRDGREFASIIDDVENRILKSIVGRGKTIPLNVRYEVLMGGDKFQVVKEIGHQARTKMFHDKVLAYISTQERKDGNLTVTIGKMSDYVDAELENVYLALNKEEKLLNSPDKWGGSNTIGGSPRNNGTSLPIETIHKIANEVA